MMLRILFKRILRHPVYLMFILVLPFLLFLMEDTITEENIIRVAVYQSGQWQEWENSAFQFYACDSEDALRDDVAAGRAECGYVLPVDLQEKMISGDFAGEVLVYESASSNLTKTINEVFFSKLFEEWSVQMYQDLLEEEGIEGARAREVLEEYRTNSSTFSIEYEILENQAKQQEGQQEEQRSDNAEELSRMHGRSRRIVGMAAIFITLAGLCGALDGCKDIKNNYFTFLYSEWKIRCMNCVLPIGIALTASLFGMLLFTGVSKELLISEIFRYLLFGFFVTAYSMAVGFLFKSEKAVMSFSVFCMLGSMICSGIWIDLSKIPVFNVIRWIFPATWFFV